MILLEVNQKAWRALGNTPKTDALFAHLGAEATRQLQGEFGQWLLELLRAQVREAIRTQRFPVPYAPLTPAWADYKARHGLAPGFWKASGSLVAELKVWAKEDGSVALGFPEDAVSTRTGQKIATYAAALERGDPSRGLPARPLFTILAARLSRQIYRLFRRFCQQYHPEHLALLPPA